MSCHPLSVRSTLPLSCYLRLSFSQWAVSFSFADESPLRFSLLPMHATRLAHVRTWFDHPNNMYLVMRRPTKHKAPRRTFYHRSHVTSFFLSLNVFLSAFLSRSFGLCFFPLVWDTKFHIHTKHFHTKCPCLSDHFWPTFGQGFLCDGHIRIYWGEPRFP